jgi:hypothetical protein
MFRPKHRKSLEQDILQRLTIPIKEDRHSLSVAQSDDFDFVLSGHVDNRGEVYP